uniref:Glycosyltransferase 61 catalytic domain-containing protein n=1 Tax=Kwoniella pini CBS 10737 TaxID=1296096 RepID=A0A1B9I5K1_9TREE|nr:uncharacterized protein I206_02871 [Kwoniella pini CBS 10737]OCF50814.1 hypothetical protein I206_02871 [Kwoniella pini CBS 10737]
MKVRSGATKKNATNHKNSPALGVFIFLGLSTLIYFGPPSLHMIKNDVAEQVESFAYSDIDFVSQYQSEGNTRCHGEGSISGLPGFYVFDKLWYKSGTFYLFSDHPETITLPKLDAITSGHNPFLVRPTSESPHHIKAKDQDSKIRCFPHEIIWLNAGIPPAAFQRRHIAKRFNWEYHHYHFLAESLLGGIASLDLVNQQHTNDINPLGERKRWLFIPYEGDWKDPYGLNEPVVNGLFGNHLVDSSAWREISSNGDWVGLEKVVLIDRWASHRYNTKANLWNKMALDVFDSLPSSAITPTQSDTGLTSLFSGYRNNFLDYMEIQPLQRGKAGMALYEVPNIIYVDRQASGRRLVPEAHRDLLLILRDLERAGLARTVVGKLEEMSYEDQIKLFAGADIVIGVHGNGLTHQVWMAPGGILIEVFPSGVFLRDYQVVSQVVGHEHVAILDNHVYTREEWESEPGKLLATSPNDANDRNIQVRYYA